MNEDELYERNIIEILRNQRDYDDEPVLRASPYSDDDQFEEYIKMLKELNDDFSNEMPNLKASLDLNFNNDEAADESEFEK